MIIAAAAVAAHLFGRIPFRTGEPPDISGEYLFKQENCSPNGCFFGSHPDFSISYLPDGERVHISKTPHGFEITHIGWKNKLMKMELSRNNKSIGWNDNQIVYKWARWGAQLGVGRQSRILQFFLDDNGSLIVESTFRETGLGFFIMPFTESYTHRMKLVRLDAS